MSKLLSASFTRLWRDKVFWVCAACMAGVGFFCTVDCWRYRGQKGLEIEQQFFTLWGAAFLMIDVFCGMFVGREYSNGMIRNKVAAGYSRAAIYLSNVIVCIVGGTLLCLAYMEGTLPLLGFFQSGLPTIGRMLLCTFALSAAVASLFTMVTMLSGNRTVAVVICILAAFLLLYVGAETNQMLIRAMADTERTYDAAGDLIETNIILDSNVLGETGQAVCKFLNDALPGGQLLQLASGYTIAHLERLLPYSLSIIIVTSAVGTTLFRRKALK